MVETTTPNQPLISVSSKHLYFFKSTQEDIIDVHQCPFIISHYATMVAEIFHLGDSTYFFWITIETIFLLNFNQSPCLGLNSWLWWKFPILWWKIPWFWWPTPIDLRPIAVFVVAGHLLQDIEMLQLGRDEVHFEGQEIA